MFSSINVEGLELSKKEEIFCEKTTTLGERLQAMALQAIETEGDLQKAEFRFLRLISDMQSFHTNFFNRKDYTSDRTGIPGTGFQLESIQAAVA